MNYGLYLSASGMLTAMHRLDIAANNLANVDTVGFKPDFTAAMQRRAERIEDGLFQIDSNALLDALGGGTLSAPTRTNFAPAAPNVTDNPLDVAILGEGFFVLDSTGDGSGDEVKFTRDGRFTLGSSGELVSAATGRAVLDTANQPIFLDTQTPVRISSDGAVEQDDRFVARLQISTVPDRASLQKVGDNLFRADPAIAGQRTATGSFVEPGSVESSGVDPIRAMMEVTNAGRDVGITSRLIQIHDETLNRAINTFGRVN